MKYRTKILTQYGFTLIELLITVAISGILMAGVYTAFKSQQDSYLAQEQVAEMQQNIRAGLDVMIRDMRMAGYDPDGTGDYGIVTANSGRFEFTLDDTNSPGDELSIAYDLFAPGYGGSSLGRSENLGSRNAVADDIEAIEFRYIDANGIESATAADIRSVQISILARARFPDRNYTNSQIYCPASNPLNGATGQCTQPDPLLATVWGPYDDNFRRRFQIMTVQLRNVGL